MEVTYEVFKANDECEEIVDDYLYCENADDRKRRSVEDKALKRLLVKALKKYDIDRDEFLKEFYAYIRENY